MKLVLTFVIMICVIGGVLYWISSNAEKNKNNGVTHVKKDYKYSKGVISQIHSYKGHSIKVKYQIDHIDYEYIGGWDSSPRNIGVGDPIAFKYSIDNPKLIITELDNDY